jgi:hypothetical protein
MNRIFLAATLALSVPFVGAVPSLADGLSGTEIKKLLIGNTVHNETVSNQRWTKTQRWI